MDVAYLKYELLDGYIDHWLVAGPQVIPVDDLPALEGADLKREVARRYHEEGPGFVGDPIERASVLVADVELTWRYTRCLDDHFVELSGFYPSAHYLRSWAYAEVLCPAAQDASFVLTSNGPADVWVNGRHVHRQEHFAQQEPVSVPFSTALERGHNRILVRLEAVAIRACPYGMALRIEGLPPSSGALAQEQQALWSSREAFRPGAGADTTLPDDVRVYLPTVAALAARQQMLEHIFDQSRVDEQVYHKGNEVIVRWDRDLDMNCHYAVSIQDARKRIYVEARGVAEPGSTIDVGHPARIWEGAYDVVLRPGGTEWYEQGTRYERRFPIHILDHEYSDTLYGTYAGRRAEALEHAAKHERNVYTQVAEMQLGRWSEVNVERVLEDIEAVNRRQDGSDLVMVGLLGMIYRFSRDRAFPSALSAPLEACVLGWKYWLDEPGIDIMCYETESHSILFHTCEILAGQLYPDRVFGNAGQTGEWHQEKGERLALEWLHRRGTAGFSEWDSNCSFEEDVVALSHLVDLAENVEVRELAAVVMDKLLLTIALNSFKGVFGSTHGRTAASMVKGGLLEPTLSITRLLWGMGIWNQHIRGVVSLACSGYEMPLVIPDIAVNLAEEMWNREQHRLDSTSSTSVNKATYRTPDYMLCSAQDYCPGDKGCRQHIWQATLGPTAAVFVTHPPNTSEAGARRPNFWCGNAILPRVAQWKDTLVAVHNLPEEDWMGFTHAYFPVYEFDEYAIDQGAAERPAWAFARSGNGYLALTASCGLKLVKNGPGAYRELRSHGQQNVWLCLMGREATDDSFQAFQDKVRALDLAFEGLAMQCTTHRGQSLSFGWEGALVVDGQQQPLSGFKHYDNPYCLAELPASEMEIRTEHYLMRLDFGAREQE